ncbi:MAG: Uma2 family endonuclease [Nitrosomonadales bacterium]|nr:Uma2 family endonuclease [Nitrosomonadales bacterium]
MSNPMLSKLSEQEYLHGELSSEIRHEYVDGEVYAMAGAGEAHNLIAGNIFAKLRDFVRGGSCRVFISDMKLHVQTWKAYYYPDILVTCDPTDNHSHFKERPSMVVEVLSPGTESTDRREKMLAYRTLSSLKEYVLVATDKQQVEIYRRDEHNEWQLAAVRTDEPLFLESVGASLMLDEIYEDVRLEHLARTSRRVSAESMMANAEFDAAEDDPGAY